MWKVKARYFWVKTDGSITEVGWEKFRELLDMSLDHPTRRCRLVRLEANWIGFFYGENYLQFPRKALEHLLQQVK
jgi:hypothetical protein